MSKERRWIPLVAVVLLVCLGAVCVLGVAGGCTYLGQLTGAEEVTSVGGGDRSSESDAAPRAETPEPVEKPEEKPETGAPSDVAGQVLVVPASDPPTLDPHLSGDANSAEYVVEIFSGLVTFDRDLNIVPDLAERWEVSDDGTVYTFYLHDDAQFQILLYSPCLFKFSLGLTDFSGHPIPGKQIDTHYRPYRIIISPFIEIFGNEGDRRIGGSTWCCARRPTDLKCRAEKQKQQT